MGFDSATAIVRTLQPERVEASRSALRRAAMIGNFRRANAGIATFTRDSFESLRKALPGAS